MNKIIFWNGIWPGPNTEWCTRSIGTYQLSHWLRKYNIESQVIDFCQWYSAEELVELTSLFISSHTQYIGLSSSFLPEPPIPDSIMEAIRIIKSQHPNIKFILGGARADSADLNSGADIIIVGEAEDKLLELITGKGIFPKFNITELDHRFIEKDAILDNEVLPIELGRGCIFKCKFCGHHNLGKPKHTYQRQIELIEEEMVYNYEKFNVKNYFFLDDTANEDIDKVNNLSKIPESIGVDINWTGYLRADLLWRYPDSPYLLEKSGLQSCFFGIESFNEFASVSIGKGWNGKHAKEYLPKLYHDIWNKNISIWNNFIIGLPGESKQDLYNTLEWCKDHTLGYNRFAPLNLYHQRSDSGSKSEFFKNYSKYGYTISESGWKNDHLTEIEAHQLVIEFNEELFKQNKLSSWILFDALSVGFDLTELKDIPANCTTFKDDKRTMFLKRLELYKSKLKELS